MNATRLIEEWRRQGCVLEVEGANTVLWRMGQGETVICVHGVPTSGFLYRKLLPELASRGLEGVTLDLPGLGLAGRPADFDYSWSGLAAWYLKAIDAAGIRNFHLVVHDIGGLSVLTSSGAFPIELSRSRFSIRSSPIPAPVGHGAFCLAGCRAALATIRANSDVLCSRQNVRHAQHQQSRGRCLWSAPPATR